MTDIKPNEPTTALIPMLSSTHVSAAPVQVALPEITPQEWKDVDQYYRGRNLVGYVKDLPAPEPSFIGITKTLTKALCSRGAPDAADLKQAVAATLTDDIKAFYKESFDHTNREAPMEALFSPVAVGVLLESVKRQEDEALLTRVLACPQGYKAIKQSLELGGAHAPEWVRKNCQRPQMLHTLSAFVEASLQTYADSRKHNGDQNPDTFRDHGLALAHLIHAVGILLIQDPQTFASENLSKLIGTLSEAGRTHLKQAMDNPDQLETLEILCKIASFRTSAPVGRVMSSDAFQKVVGHIRDVPRAVILDERDTNTSQSDPSIRALTERLKALQPVGE